MEKVDIIKNRLKEALQRSKYTQTDLAGLVSISQSCIAHYLKGDILPSLDTFSKLCEVLDEDANYILGIKEK